MSRSPLCVKIECCESVVRTWLNEYMTCCYHVCGGVCSVELFALFRSQVCITEKIIIRSELQITYHFKSDSQTDFPDISIC